MVDLNQQMIAASRLIRRSIGAGIELMLELTPDAPVVAIDSSRLHNALLNLALNARDAMEGGGRLMIETLSNSFDASNIPAETRLKPGNYVLIRVMDTGSGMTPEVRARATEAFFTTKPSGKGSGMGLSMVFGMVVKAGGAMQIESEPGEGTTINLWLPVHRTEAASAADDADAVSPESNRRAEFPVAPVEDSCPPELVGGQETLLVADDDPRIRRLTVRFLEELGYRVIEVGDGSAARTILESKQGDEIDLLFTDIVMPGDLDGVSLGHWVQKNRPRVKVLLSSGFGNEGDGHGMDTGDLPFLPKPFAQRALAHAVRGVLDQQD
jgi:CheY-like chemotaxis protein